MRRLPSNLLKRRLSPASVKTPNPLRNTQAQNTEHERLGARDGARILIANQRQETSRAR